MIEIFVKKFLLSKMDFISFASRKTYCAVNRMKWYNENGKYSAILLKWNEHLRTGINSELSNFFLKKLTHSIYFDQIISFPNRISWFKQEKYFTIFKNILNCSLEANFHIHINCESKVWTKKLETLKFLFVWTREKVHFAWKPNLWDF